MGGEVRRSLGDQEEEIINEKGEEEREKKEKEKVRGRR